MNSFQYFLFFDSKCLLQLVQIMHEFNKTDDLNNFSCNFVKLTSAIFEMGLKRLNQLDG